MYNTPRIHPVQFGDLAVADHGERETILQGAKFVRRVHKARAWFAKDEITKFLTSPLRKLGDLHAAVDHISSVVENESFSDETKADAIASKECISSFIKMMNKISLHGKEILNVDDDQYPLKIGGLSIHLDLACVVRYVDKSGQDRVGGVFLNTQKGKGLGTKDDTKRKRDKAGESIAILVLKKLQDEFSDYGEPAQEEAIHLYVRGGHYWPAPKAYATKLKNLDAAARAIVAQWDAIQPPADFDPSRAKFHD